MALKKIDAYEAYLSAWSAIGDGQRQTLLQASLTPSVVFENFTKNRSGIAEVTDHLERFQVSTPGGSFQLLSMLGFQNNGLAVWQLVDGVGNNGFKGYDILTFGEDGRIATIVMFVDVDPQKIK